MENAISDTSAHGDAVSDVAGRIARQSMAKRSAEYTVEVRKLLDAALAVMSRCGTDSRPRVADIVEAAGLSNDAFYRHFRSKDALVVALLEDGADRLHGHLTHQMAKAATPEDAVRTWVEVILAQARPDAAATALAVLWNGGSLADGLAAGRHFASAPLAELLRTPFAELGSPTPDEHASLAAHAALGRLSDLLWQRQEPTPDDVGRITTFLCNAVTTPVDD